MVKPTISEVELIRQEFIILDRKFTATESNLQGYSMLLINQIKEVQKTQCKIRKQIERLISKIPKSE
jgi:predicted  nucleic acid-binding Zn-ribbon protein